MTSINSHIDTLIALRTELIEKRRICASESRAAGLPEIVAQIDAVDRAICDEKRLAEVLT